MTPLIVIHNAQTGENIEREMTAAEYTQYTADQAAYALKATQVAKADTDAAALRASAIKKLTALGLTAGEAETVIG